jgi:hypothetical protein
LEGEFGALGHPELRKKKAGVDRAPEIKGEAAGVFS